MNKESRLITWINVIIVAIFVILVFSQSNKKFVLDEVDFPAVAKTISETGMPYEYRGEAEPLALGLWHPPLYAYSLGAFVKVFGSNENTVRAFGMCCTLISALLSLLIYRELFFKQRGRWPHSARASAWRRTRTHLSLDGKLATTSPARRRTHGRPHGRAASRLCLACTSRRQDEHQQPPDVAAHTEDR